MDKIANASRHALAYVREETRGVTPADPAMKYLRHTSCNLNLTRDAFTSAELRRDRQISDVRTLANKITALSALSRPSGSSTSCWKAAWPAPGKMTSWPAAWKSAPSL